VTFHKVVHFPDKDVHHDVGPMYGKCVPCGTGGGGGGGGCPGCGGGGADGGAKNVCGPDITQALAQTVRNMYNVYTSNPALRAALCGAFWGPMAMAAVDITDIFAGGPGGGCATGTCGETVMVDGQCHNAWVVNYIGMGVGYGLCRWVVDIWWFPAEFPNLVYPYCMARHWDDFQCRCAEKWFAAGMNGWPGAPTPRDCRPECTNDCKERTTGAFTVYWDAVTINADGSWNSGGWWQRP